MFLKLTREKWRKITQWDKMLHQYQWLESWMQ